MNCDPIARWYRWLEYAGFGGELERRRHAFLPMVADARRILTLGEGDGRFLVKLAEQNREARIDYVDLSGRMLALARHRAGTENTAYRKADALTVLLPDMEYDLIATHFFLDCFDERDAAALVKRVAAAARADARWVISEFRQPKAGWRAVWARVWLRGLYLFFRVTTGLKTQQLVDHHPLLEREGFKLAYVQTARFGLLSSELWARYIT